MKIEICEGCSLWAEQFNEMREDRNAKLDEIEKLKDECLRRGKEMAGLFSRINRLEADLACTHSGNEIKEWMKSGETMHEKFIAVENQLVECRRNFAIVAKLLRGTP